jgi:hypothetical protein
MKTPFFTMQNNHTAECGEPPIFSNDAGGKYFGYFENALGEQWVFVYDRETKRADLYGGDVEWKNALSVREGTVEGLQLGRDEMVWLMTCWRAATGKG